MGEDSVYNITIPRDELDRNMGGGIPKNSIVLMSGVDGAGKSIVCQRLAYGMLQSGTSITYISTELNTQGFIEQMSSIDYDVKYEMLDQKLVFIPMFPYFGESKLKDDFLDRLMNAKELFKNEVIIFDTLSFLLVHDDIKEEQIYKFIRFVKSLNSIEKTVIATVDPEHLNEKFVTLLKSVADCILSIEIRLFAGAPIRVISVQRYKRSADTVNDVIPFKVEPGAGFAIEIASFG